MADKTALQPKRFHTAAPLPTDLHVQLLNSINEAVIATDLSGKVVFWNSVAETIYGWKWQEVIGQLITDLVVPPASQQEAAKIMEQLRAGKSWTGPFKVRRRDGTEFVATVTDRPIRDSRGNLVAIVGVSHPEDG